MRQTSNIPGTPHHALGDPRLTAIATTLITVAVVGGLLVIKRRFTNHGTYAAVGGVCYGLVYLSLWALVPAIFWRFAATPEGNPLFFIGAIVLAGAILFVQAAVPLYLHSRWSLKLPLGGLVAASLICGYLFFRVGGESGATFLLFLWTLMLAPVAIVGISLLGAIEEGVRRVATGGNPL